MAIEIPHYTVHCHEFHIHYSCDTTVGPKLDAILTQLSGMAAQEQLIMADITSLTAQVAANTDAEQSAITLLNGLSALLKAAGTDPAKLQALQDSLKSGADSLAAAIVENTPAGPSGGMSAGKSSKSA